MNHYKTSYSLTNQKFYQHKNRQKLSFIDFNKTLHIINAEIRKQFNQTRSKKMFNETSRNKSFVKFKHNRLSSLDLLYFENQSVSQCLKQDFFQSFNKKYYQLQNQFKASFPIKRILSNKKRQRKIQQFIMKDHDSKSWIVPPKIIQTSNKTSRMLSKLQKIKFQHENYSKINKYKKIGSFTQSKIALRINNQQKDRKSDFQNLKNDSEQLIVTIAKKKDLIPRKIKNTDMKHKMVQKKFQSIFD